MTWFEFESCLCEKKIWPAWVKIKCLVRKDPVFATHFKNLFEASVLLRFSQIFYVTAKEECSVILTAVFWEALHSVRTPQDEEFGLQLCLARFIWKAMKLPGPGTHFHHNEPKLNQDWMLFSSEIEGGLCAGFKVVVGNFLVWVLRANTPLCIFLQIENNVKAVKSSGFSGYITIIFNVFIWISVFTDKKGHLVLIFPVFSWTKIMLFSCLAAALAEPDLSELSQSNQVNGWQMGTH